MLRITGGRVMERESEWERVPDIGIRAGIVTASSSPAVSL